MNWVLTLLQIAVAIFGYLKKQKLINEAEMKIIEEWGDVIKQRKQQADTLRNADLSDSDIDRLLGGSPPDGDKRAP